MKRLFKSKLPPGDKQKISVQRLPPATITSQNVALQVAPPPPVAMQPGDFLLTHGHGLMSALIRFGQRLRFFGADAKYTHWSHCALFVDANGTIIEAVGTGVCQSQFSKYDAKERHIVHFDSLSPEDRDQQVK